MLRRTHDFFFFFFTYTSVPTFCGRLNVVHENDFIWTLPQVALRRCHTKLFIHQCWSSAREWRRSLYHLTHQLSLQNLQVLVQNDPGLPQNDMVTAEWLRRTISIQYTPPMVDSEVDDGLRQRKIMENDLMAVLNRGIADAASVQVQGGDLAPVFGSRCWAECLRAVRRFYTAAGKRQCLDRETLVQLAQVIWRVTRMSWKVCDTGETPALHDELVSVYIQDMFAMQETTARGRMKWSKKSLETCLRR